MIFTDTLQSFEAEESVTGFFFNRHIEEDKKKQILQLVQPEHFTTRKGIALISLLKIYEIFDKLVLWEKVKSHKTAKLAELEWLDFERLDDFVREEDIDSYVNILIDKYQKRQLHEFGKEIQDAVQSGEDQFELALRAQHILSRISSKVKIQTNQELLEKVLTEKPSDIISTGYDAIDNFIGGFTRGMIVTIGGDAGHLKTTLALDQAFRMAERNPTLKIGIFSKEMTAETMIKKQISRICGIPTNKIFSQNYDRDFVKKEMMKVPAWKENRIRIIDPNIFTGVADIARIQMTYRFDIWFLDFIQLLEFTKVVSSSSDYNIQVGQNMRNLQSLSLATKSVGIVLSQVKKGIEYRQAKKPTVSDLEWSGLIKQLSAYIFFSYYPGKYYGFNKIPKDHHFLLGEKTRFAETFTYPMQVDPELGIFKEIKDEKKRQEMTALLTQILEKEPRENKGMSRS